MKLPLFNKHRQHFPTAAGDTNETLPGQQSPNKGLAKRKGRGQSLVEAALVLPLIVLFLSVVIEGGLALNAWIRVNTAARDAARFALDAGPPQQVGSLVLTKLHGIDFGSNKEFTGSLNIDVYQITGLTDSTGNIPNDTTHWNVYHIYGPGSSASVSRTTITTRIQQQGDPTNIPFVIVEVDFKYTPVLSNIIAPNTKLPMMSYALMEKDPNN